MCKAMEVWESKCGCLSKSNVAGVLGEMRLCKVLSTRLLIIEDVSSVS